jgi:uncharacterized protein YoxC
VGVRKRPRRFFRIVKTLTKTTKHQVPSFGRWWKREKKAAFLCTLAIIVVIIIVLLLNLRFPETKPPNHQPAHLFLTKNSLSFSKNQLNDLAKATKQARAAEKLAKKALEKEREREKEMETVKETLKQLAFDAEKRVLVEKEPGILAKIKNLLRSKEVERQVETQREREHETERIVELESSMEKALEKIMDLEAESMHLKRHAEEVEGKLERVDREFDTVASTMRSIDKSLHRDFASVDADLCAIDRALVSSLSRHHEERNKINEVIEQVRVLGEFSNWHDLKVEKIDGVAEVVGENRDILREHQRHLDRHDDEIDSLTQTLESQAATLKRVTDDLYASINRLNRVAQEHGARHDKLVAYVEALQRDLSRLHKAVTSDMRTLNAQVSKVAQKPLEALQKYQKAIETVVEQVDGLQDDLRASEQRLQKQQQQNKQKPDVSIEPALPAHSTSLPAADSQFDHDSWFSRFSRLEARLRHLEEAREQALRHLTLEREESRMRRQLDAQIARSNAMYDVEAGEKRVQRVWGEVEEMAGRPMREREYEEMRERLLAPAKRVIAELDAKYKDAPLIGALFSKERRN